MLTTAAENGCSTARLTTARLLLRGVRPGEMSTLSDIAEPLRNAPDNEILAIARAAEGDTIGLLRLQPRAAGASLAFWLAGPFQCQGYLVEAMRRLLRHVFENAGTAQVLVDAASSAHTRDSVLNDLGFAAQPGGDFVITRQNWLTTQAPPTILVSAAVLIDPDDRILLTQRPAGKEMAGLWEFPGGKVEPGETPEAALIRELREELGVDTVQSCLAPLTFASHHYERFHLLMPLFACRVWQGTPTPRERQQLAWVRIDKLRQYPMPPADEPLIAMLRDFL